MERDSGSDAYLRFCVLYQVCVFLADGIIILVRYFVSDKRRDFLCGILKD